MYPVVIESVMAVYLIKSLLCQPKNGTQEAGTPSRKKFIMTSLQTPYQQCG